MCCYDFGASVNDTRPSRTNTQGTGQFIDPNCLAPTRTGMAGATT